MHPRRYQEHLVDVGRQQVSEIADYRPRYVKHHRISPFVQVFPFYLCFISYLETSWYLPSFTYLSIWLIPISHYLQKLVVTRQITSYHFASSLSVHSEYLSFSLRRPASRTFVQRFPSPASIAQRSVLRPESSLAFSIEFSVVSSLPTSCTTLASFCLVSVPSPPSVPHSSSSFYIVSTFSKVWDSSGSHHYFTVLDSRLYYILGLLKVCPCTFIVFRCFVVQSTRVHITIHEHGRINECHYAAAEQCQQPAGSDRSNGSSRTTSSTTASGSTGSSTRNHTQSSSSSTSSKLRCSSNQSGNCTSITTANSTNNKRTNGKRTQAVWWKDGEHQGIHQKLPDLHRDQTRTVRQWTSKDHVGTVLRVLRSSCCDWKLTGNWTGLQLIRLDCSRSRSSLRKLSVASRSFSEKIEQLEQLVQPVERLTFGCSNWSTAAQLQLGLKL